MAHQKKEEIQPIKAEFDDVSNALVAIPSEIRKALYEGKLPIGDIELDCAVLDNGIRVLSERAVHRSFKSKRGGSHWRRIKENPDGANLPSFLSAKNINPFISKELMMALSSPIKYMSSGGRNSCKWNKGRPHSRYLRSMVGSSTGWGFSAFSRTLSNSSRNFNDCFC